MYKKDFPCNPKHLALMQRAIKRIYERTFNEDDIRLLLLGVRAFTQEVVDVSKSDDKAPSSIKIGHLYLSDICHSIAHPEHKTQGPFRSFIKKTDSGMKKSTENMSSRKILKIDNTNKIIHLLMPPHQKPISSQEVIAAFIFSLEVVIKNKLDRENILSQTNDILLCIFSIMHYTQFPLYEDVEDEISIMEKKGGYLGLQSWEGHYHLYAGVINSDFETIFTKKRDANFINTFPVMHSSKQVNDGLQLDIRNPQLVVADRDSSGALVLQRLNSKMIFI